MGTIITDTPRGRYEFPRAPHLASEAAKREVQGEPMALADKIRIVAATRTIGHGIRVPDIVFTGSAAACAATVSGSVAATMIPPLPADHLAEARKQIISGQLFLIILITLIVLAMPAAVLASDLPPDAQAVILAYDGVLAAFVAGYGFSDRGKRKPR
jgi:putative Ca2+/H+ antiporter (TMEM165/GDT1 family)